MDLRVIKTKTNIQNAMLTCLASQYFSEITVNAICKAAQCSRSTFYAHYDHKIQVIDDIADQIIEQIKPYMKQTFEKPEELLSVIDSLSQQLYQPHKDIIKLLLDPEFKDFGLEARLETLFKEQFLQRFEHIKGKEIISEMYSSCVMCNIKAIIENRTNQEEQEAIEELKVLLFQKLEKNQARKS